MDINGDDGNELKEGTKPKKPKSKQGKDEETAMLGAVEETLSTKERTKKRFEQLLKAALEDASNKKATLLDEKQKRSKTKSGGEGLQETLHNDNISTATEPEKGTRTVAEVKKLHKGKKKKRHKDEGGEKEGLINSAFESEEKLVVIPSASELSEDGDGIDLASKRKKKSKLKGGLPVVPEVRIIKATTRRTQNEFGSESDDERQDLEEPNFQEGTIVTSTPVRVSSKHGLSPSMQKNVQQLSESVHDSIASNSSSDNSDIMSVKIHRVDRLQMNVAIKHPLVRIHVVDSRTGSYLEKKDRERSVTNVYENRNAKVTYILPIMTQPFDLKQKRSLIPIWEEALLFNERFDHFIHPDSNAVLFFEILDFLPMQAIQDRYNHLGVNSGWYHVAWAFLKLVGANGILNTERKVQLQLYCPPKQRMRAEPRVVEVFHWWSSLPRVRYPATLYVTVSRLNPPARVEPALRSSVPMQEEKGMASRNPGEAGNDSLNIAHHDSTVLSPSHDAQNAPYPWLRLPGQSCKVPNRSLLCLRTASKGCFSICFSHCGRLMACGCHDGTTSPILIYKIPSGELHSQVAGHMGLIYEIHFSRTDDSVVSASADGTARIWVVSGGEISPSCIALPHPSYVYTAQFHPSNSQVVVTGCYDTVIRIWSMAYADRSSQLLQELEGHRCNVNSLCFEPRGIFMFSGDGKGVIRVWTIGNSEDIDESKSVPEWKAYQEIVDPDLEGISISLMFPHPAFPRLIVQGQDGAIRMLDSQSYQVLRRYEGYLNVREYVRGCISPCGNLILTGSEDGCGYVWNMMTGDQVAVYSDLPYGQTVHSVSFHPHDHLVAFCSYGSSSWPVVIYRYDPYYAQLSVSRVQAQASDNSNVHSSSAMMISKGTEPFTSSSSPAVDAVDSFPGTGSETIIEKIMRRLDSVLAVSQDDLHPGPIEMPSSPGWGSTFDGLNLNPNAPVIQKVVALFDYVACRSDETSFKRGDVIDILCQESDEWWIGRTSSGQYGYLPANHVSPLDVEVATEKNIANCDSNVNDDFLKLDSKPREVTAILTKSGNLTFISASEDEASPAPSTPSKRQRRRRRKDRELRTEWMEQSDV